MIAPRLLAKGLIAILAALAAALGVYLAGEDEYLNDGTSRWSSRSDDAAALATLWATAGIFLVTIAVLAAAARKRRGALVAAGTTLAVVTVAGFFFTLLAYTSN